ncbi:MAG: hypothetical protein D6753_08870 [Planctomycetota bacterium]|nr:MAG: hypothetical protein D6753_08870 [Planctomycetota bacterium]
MHQSFDERFLQDLLANHPGLLPVAEIRGDVGPLMCIGREVAVPSGVIDNLYLSTQGYPVLVETKLWRNPQARREVLSQTLDYIKDLVQKDFDWFAGQWAQYRNATGHEHEDLVVALNELSDDEIDEPFIVDRVNRALSRGDVIALIVGDGIETRLLELVMHLCKDSSHLRYSLALVEMACYKLNEHNEEILVVPRIVQDVEPVQRAYVRVDVAESLQDRVVVTPVIEPEPEATRSTTRVSLNEEEFLQSIEASAGRMAREQIQCFYNDLIESFQLEPVFKASALMLKVPHPDDDGTGASVLGIEKHGRVYNTQHIKHQLRRWGVAPSLVDKIAAEYWAALHTVDARFREGGIVHLAAHQFIPFPEIVQKLPQIKHCVGRVVSAVREAYENL